LLFLLFIFNDAFFLEPDLSPFLPESFPEGEDCPVTLVIFCVAGFTIAIFFFDSMGVLPLVIH